MERYILSDLKEWKDKIGRKPLILQGVRQTGKTYVLKEFGETCFQQLHYLNFELNPGLVKLFQGDFQPTRILTDLRFVLGRDIDPAHDLLIFDEIQACPPALTSLKYFAEQLPELAVCCAGSLLGLTLSESSFPVGKVEFMSMYPMSFSEFLLANEETAALGILNQCSLETSLSETVHSHLWEQFKIYLVTGGLPEVVQTYLHHKANPYLAFQAVRQKQNDLIFGYYADIAKHSGKVSAMQIDRLWRAIPSQLAKTQDGSSQRFQFKGIIPGIDRYQRLANVIDWLLAAHLIIKVPCIAHVELPLSAYTEASFFKLYVFDVGILAALSDLSAQSILAYDYGTYKGYYAENFIAQELQTRHQVPLYSWQEGHAEIEFLFAKEASIIPIEVKSGWVTRNQSLNKYAEKYHPPYRVTFSGKPLLIDAAHQYHRYPLYMAYWFPL